MTQSTVAAYIHQPFDVHGYLSSQIAFHFMLIINNVSDAGDILIRNVIRFQISVYTGLLQYLSRRRSADTKNIGKGYFHSFSAREVNT
jgi:hypothetical protein